MILCFRCGEMNDPRENYCLKCGATLPKLAYKMEMPSVDMVLDLYYKFAGVIDKVRNGQASVSQFEEFLVKQYEKQKAYEQALHDLEIPDNLAHEFEEEFEVGFQGIDRVNEGMEIMSFYLEDRNDDHLDHGMALILEGSELIHKAKLINRKRDRCQSQVADLQRMFNDMEL